MPSNYPPFTTALFYLRDVTQALWWEGPEGLEPFRVATHVVADADDALNVVRGVRLLEPACPPSGHDADGRPYWRVSAGATGRDWPRGVYAPEAYTAEGLAYVRVRLDLGEEADVKLDAEDFEDVVALHQGFKLAVCASLARYGLGQVAEEQVFLDGELVGEDLFFATFDYAELHGLEVLS